MTKDENLQLDNIKKISHLKSVELLKVIRTITFYGNGTEVNPNRLIEQYWSLDGKLLATVDPLR